MSTWHTGAPPAAGTYYLCVEKPTGSEVVIAHFDPAKPRRHRVIAWSEYRDEWQVDASQILPVESGD